MSRAANGDCVLQKPQQKTRKDGKHNRIDKEAKNINGDFMRWDGVNAVLKLESDFYWLFKDCCIPDQRKEN